MLSWVGYVHKGRTFIMTPCPSNYNLLQWLADQGNRPDTSHMDVTVGHTVATTVKGDGWCLLSKEQVYHGVATTVTGNSLALYPSRKLYSWIGYHRNERLSFRQGNCILPGSGNNCPYRLEGHCPYKRLGPLPKEVAYCVCIAINVKGNPYPRRQF